MSYYLTTHLSHSVSLPYAVIKKVNSKHKILDIGCGNGALKKLFHSNKIYGVDINKAGVKLSLKAGYFQARRVDIDKQKLPFRKDFFDVVICRQVLEHLYSPLFATKEIFRVLNKTGLLFVSVPTQYNSKYYDDYTHVRPFTNHSLETLLKDAGFKHLEFTYSLIGIPGLGAFERLTGLKIPDKQKFAEKFPWLREKANIEVIARQ